MAKYFTLYDIIEDPNTSFLVLSDKWEYVQVELGRDGVVTRPTAQKTDNAGLS